MTCVLWEGGEPLLRKDWKEILTYAQQLDIHNRVLTSGAPLANKKMAEKVITAVDSLEIHFDTIDEKQPYPSFAF